MKVFGYLITFMAGSMFGVFTMALMVNSSRYSRKEEVMDLAGRYREQNRESGGQHDEADSPDSNFSSSGVSEAPEGSEGRESDGESPVGTAETDRETDG